MKDRLKRFLALMLALLLFAGTVFTDNLFPVGASTAGNSDQLQQISSQGNEQTPSVLTSTPSPRSVVQVTFDIKGERGETLNGAVVTVTQNGNPVSAVPTNDKQFNLNEGENYQYQVTCNKFEPVNGSVTVSANNNQIDVSMKALRKSVSFQVTGYDGNPVPNAQINVESDNESFNVVNGQRFDILYPYEYSWTADAAGYLQASGDIKDPETCSATIPVNLQLDDIKLSTYSWTAHSGGVQSIQILNPVEGAVYSWSAEPSDGTVTIQQQGNYSANLTAQKTTNNSADMAVVKVSLGGKTVQCNVTVNQKSMDSLTFNVKPLDKNGQLTEQEDDAVGASLCLVPSAQDEQDASGTVEYLYSEDGKEPFTSIGTAAIGAPVKFAGEDAKVLQTGVWFKAVYSGDHNYPQREECTGKIQYYQTEDLKFTDEFRKDKEGYTWSVDEDGETPVLTIDYDTFVSEQLEIAVEEENATNVPFKYVIKGNSVKKVSEPAEEADHRIQLSELGVSTITVTRDQDDVKGYRGAQLVFKIVVTKKVSIADFSWNAENAAPVYAGRTDQTYVLNGRYDDPTIYDTPITVSVKAVVSANGSEVESNAGIYDQMLMVDANDDAEDGFTLIFNDQDTTYFKLDAESLEGDNLIVNQAGILQIQKKELHVGIKNSSLDFTFAKNTKSKINGEITSDAYKGNVTWVSDDEIIEDDKSEITAILDEVKLKLTGTAAEDEELFVTDPGNNRYEKTVSPNLDNVSSTNYEFIAEKENYGNLIIVSYDISETSFSELISVSGSNYYVASLNDDVPVFWVKSQGGNLILKPNQGNDIFKEYDQVILNGNGLEEFNISENPGYQGQDNGTIQDNETYSLYLNDTEDAGGLTKTTGTKELYIYEDADAPIVTFTGDPHKNENILDSLLKTISFGLYDNETYYLDYTIEDQESGLVSASYHVIQIDPSMLDENGTINAQTIEKLVNADDLPQDWWKECSSSGSVEVPDAQGAYLVLIKARDQVNNERIYASNGVVIDHDRPDVKIEGLDSDIVYGFDEQNPDQPEKVTYQIIANDGVYVDPTYGDAAQLGVSGIGKVETEVYVDGLQQEKDSRVFYADPTQSPNPDGTIPMVEDVPYDGFTSVPEVKSYTQNFELNPDYNSNNIEIRVTVYDRAGNKLDTVKQTIKVDRTRPVIKISYDNNEDTNDKYFKETSADQPTRTATVVFVERNFDPEKALFHLKLENGTVYNWVTLEEIGQIDGITVSEIEDSQNGWDVYTDKRKNTAKVEFWGDNAYSEFGIQCTDNAGHSTADVDVADGTSAWNDFVVDNTAPVITVSYSADGTSFVPGRTENDRVYKNRTISAVISVQEHNFRTIDNEGNYTFGETPVNYDVSWTKNRDDQTMSDYQAEANTASNWNQNTDLWTNTFIFSNDANYITNFAFTDLAGNRAEWGQDFFTCDKTAPTGWVKVGDRNPWTSFLNSITFYLFSKNTVSVSMGGDDFTSPVKSIQSMKSYSGLSKTEVAAYKNWQNTTSFSINPNEQFVPYEKVTDMAGNVAYFSSDVITVVDNQKPLNQETAKPIITITTAEPVHDIFNGDVSYKIHAEDPVVGNTYSGLQSVKYEVLSNNTVTQTATYTFDPQKRQRTMDTSEVVIARQNNTNHVKIRVTAIDNAGNECVEEKEIKIDITPPEISVTFDNNSPLNGKYYKDTRTATVVIKERNFDPNNVQINITNTDGTQPAISGWSHSAGAGESDSATHTATISFAADGDYNFTVDCTDLAMNKASNPYKADEFTIDKTLPTIQVSYDNNSAENGTYYKAARTATISITEHNFQASDVKVTTTASNNGNGVSAPGVSGWSTSGDRHTATVYFGSDADYTFDIAYTDMAGNAAADYAQDSFTVDLTKPELEITGISNKSANKGTVAPMIRISDTNFSSSDVTVTLTGANKGKISLDSLISRSSIANGQSISFRNFPAGMDDIYTLSAKSVDKAGNETSKTITFSVNRDGSTYEIDKNTLKIMEDQNGFTNNPQDVVIQEINVDTLEFVEITISKDGTVKTLKEGSDFEVVRSGNEGEWKKYTYTIFAENFQEEGNYIINIYSEDRAENTNTNQSKAKTVELIVDKTAPTMVISNLENSGRYSEDTHQFTLTVKDNMLLSYVELYLDGELYHVYKDDELVVDNGQLVIDLGSKNDWQSVKLIAYDQAGNPTDPIEYNVLVTSSKWVQFVNNKILLYGSIACVILAAAIIILIVVKRKKDR